MPFEIGANLWTLIILSTPIFIYYVFARENMENSIKYSLIAIPIALFLTNTAIIPSLIGTVTDNESKSIYSMLKDEPAPENITIELPKEIPNPYMNITVETPKNETAPWDNDWLGDR